MDDQLNYKLLLYKIDRAFSEGALALCLTSIKELIETNAKLVEKYRVRIGLLEWHQEKSKKAQDPSDRHEISATRPDWQEDKTTSIAKFQNELSKCIGNLKNDKVIDDLIKGENEETESVEPDSNFNKRELKIINRNIDLKSMFSEFRNTFYGNISSKFEDTEDIFNHGYIVLSEKFDEEKYVEVEMRIEENLNLIRFYYVEEDTETEYFVDTLSNWWDKQLRKVKIFISYSHRDAEWKNELLMQFYPMNKQGIIDQFDDSQIRPGQEWEPSIFNKMKKSDIILFLVSPDLMHSEYVDTKELPLAERLHKDKKSVVIPIFVRWISVEGTFLGQIQGFPNSNYGYRFLDKAPNREEALYHVAQDVGKFVREIYSKR